ncbi:MAG: AAA family ATPase [Symbiobacteriia bacterium]
MTNTGPSYGIDPGNDRIQQLLDNIEATTVGKRAAAELLVCALIAGGHVLLEDIPGIGKTLLAKALAAATGLHYSRVQCTPDLLPSDITGASIWSPQQGEFQFRPGPVFANLVLVDEINRSSPRSQSALLEAMEERQVTVDDRTYPLADPFVIIATENPLDAADAFPLPSSQLDRFLFRLSIGYPTVEEEVEILRQARVEVNAAKVALLAGQPAAERQPVIGVDEVRDLTAASSRIHVSDKVLHYVADVLQATRGDARIALGASPRAGALWMRAAKAWALMQGRAFVIPDDIRFLAVPVLAHRLRTQAGHEAETVIQDVLEAVPVPRGDGR